MLNKTNSNAIQANATPFTTGPITRPKFQRALRTCSRPLSKLTAMGMAYAKARACTPTLTKAVKALLLPRLMRPRRSWMAVTRARALRGMFRVGWTLALEEEGVSRGLGWGRGLFS